MFQQLLPAAFIEQAQKDAGVRGNNRVYTPLVVMWLLILQRLLGAASLETAVLRLFQDLPPSFWPRPCKRIREWRERGKPMSSNTGAYNQARQALPLPVVQQSCDRIFDGLMRQMTSHGDEPAMPAFVLDGSSMRMAHSPSLSERFPPGWNQHGEGHWPWCGCWWLTTCRRDWPCVRNGDPCMVPRRSANSGCWKRLSAGCRPRRR